MAGSAGYLEARQSCGWVTRQLVDPGNLGDLSARKVQMRGRYQRPRRRIVRNRPPAVVLAGWVSAGMVAPIAAGVLLVTLRSAAGTTEMSLLMLAVILAVAATGSRWAAAAAAVTGAVTFDYFLTHPYQSVTIASRHDLVAVGLLLVSGLLIGQIAARAARGYIEVLLVVLAAALAQAVPAPGRWLDGRHAIDVVLAVLVFATAIGIPAGSVRALRANRARIIAVLVASAALLPVLSWSAAGLVTAPVLRRGVLVLGLAPAEVASVATVSVAGGDTAIASGLLVGSTLLTVLGAGPILGLMAAGAAVHPLGVLVNLAVVIAAPLAIGLAARPAIARIPYRTEMQQAATVGAVTILVWLVASEVVITTAYLGVAAAAAAFLTGSAMLGVLLGRGAPGPVATGVLLTTSMRDFAVAAGIAASAFGPPSAAPLGLYGVLVIVWGMALASTRRRRDLRALAAP
jgi:predicted Na+-dependent transporter